MTLACIPLLAMYGYKAENLPQIVGKAKAIRTSKAYFQHDREGSRAIGLAGAIAVFGYQQTRRLS
jgi:hypothetical protein